MKRNIYSYSKLWMIFFVLMGAACTNQVEDAIPVSGQPIGFSVQSDWKEIPNTRSNDGKTEFSNGDTIQIFGFHTSSGVKKKFMYRVGEEGRGQIVKYDGGNWIYSPKRFWPKEGTLDFYASYPQYSVLNDEDRMIYKQEVNPLQLDLLWGVSTGHNCKTTDRSSNVVITMKHALAKVIIKFDSSLGIIKQAKVSAYKAGYFSETIQGIPKWIVEPKSDENIQEATIKFDSSLGIIKQAKVSAYKAGYFSETIQGIPKWIVEPKSDENIQEATIKPYYQDQTAIEDATVFILPDKITGLILTTLDGEEINVSEEIQKYTFEAGKAYKLTIRRAQKNTNSRSIAMSVRCVSE